MKMKLLVFLMICGLTLFAGGSSGCTTGTVIQDASAVQLEAALISMLNNLLTTVVYGAFDLPLTTGYGV